MGDFGLRPEIRQKHTQQGGGVDQIPFFDKAQMQVRLMVVVVVAVGAVDVVRGVEGVQRGVCGEVAPSIDCQYGNMLSLRVATPIEPT